MSLAIYLRDFRKVSRLKSTTWSPLPEIALVSVFGALHQQRRERFVDLPLVRGRGQTLGDGRVQSEVRANQQRARSGRRRRRVRIRRLPPRRPSRRRCFGVSRRIVLGVADAFAVESPPDVAREPGEDTLDFPGERARQSLKPRTPPSARRVERRVERRSRRASRVRSARARASAGGTIAFDAASGSRGVERVFSAEPLREASLRAASPPSVSRRVTPDVTPEARFRFRTEKHALGTLRTARRTSPAGTRRRRGRTQLSIERRRTREPRRRRDTLTRRFPLRTYFARTPRPPLRHCCSNSCACETTHTETGPEAGGVPKRPCGFRT